jgi:hypothetical protein
LYFTGFLGIPFGQSGCSLGNCAMQLKLQTTDRTKRDKRILDKDFMGNVFG